jgi:hypothetical protein
MKLTKAISALLLLLPATVAIAQHSDIELGYDNLASPTAFVIQQDDQTSEGYQIFESNFVIRDPFSPDDFSSSQPGFATPAQGVALNSGDRVWLTAVDARLHSSAGVGFVNYFNPTSNTLQATGRVSLRDNSGATADLVLSGTSIESGEVEQFVDTASAGGAIHDHVVLDLLDEGTAPLGAYGIMFQLQSDFSSPDGTMDLSSEPFWIVWNYGMTPADFSSIAIPQFGVSSTVVLLGDINLDGTVNFLDISPFISVLSGTAFQAEADCNESGAVDFLDITPFIGILSGSGS